MKIRTKLGAMVISLFAVGMICIGGCATTKMGATKTTNKMQTVENDMKEAVLQVDATNSSLQAMMQPDQVDVKRALDAYGANVKKMENIGKQLDRHDEQMRAQGKEYFAEWERKGDTYTNPQLREASEERRAELSKIFGKVPEASTGMKDALNTYLSELKQIQSYLSTDMTRKGVEAIAPVAEKAIIDGENLKDRVKPVISAMDRAMAEMASDRGAAAGGK